MCTSISYVGPVQAGAGIWTPPTTVTDHLGGKLDPEEDFFVAPPREIGEIKSAYTSLKKGITARSRGARIAITVVWWAAACFILALGIAYVVRTYAFEIFRLWFFSDFLPVVILLSPVIGAVAAFIAWRKTRFVHACTFVGAEGCAHFGCRRKRENIRVKSVFLFKDACAVWTRMVEHYRGVTYWGTDFIFGWFACPPESERRIFAIGGRHYSGSKAPPADSYYHYGRAAEAAWYGYLIPKDDEEIAQKGHVNFYLGGKHSARVGPGFFEFMDSKGNVSRCEAGEIGSAFVPSGTFVLARKDAVFKHSEFRGADRSTGVILQCDYSSICNGRLFLLAVEKFLGIKVGS